MKFRFEEDDSELEKLQALVNSFGKTQIERLGEKIAEEWDGWDNRKDIREDLVFRIIRNMFEGDWVDVANLAMFAWNLNLNVKECVEKIGGRWL